MIEVRHHLSRIYVGRDGVPEGAKVTAEVQQVPSHEDGLLAFDTILTITPRPKRYVLPMPYGADDDDPDDSHYAVVNREYHAGPAWHQGPCVSFKEAREHYSVTQSDIDAAPKWVQVLERVEVTDHE